MDIIYIFILLLVALDLVILSYLIDARKRVKHLESISGVDKQAAKLPVEKS